jgi:YVTN family beta-propeller protein
VARGFRMKGILQSARRRGQSRGLNSAVVVLVLVVAALATSPLASTAHSKPSALPGPMGSRTETARAGPASLDTSARTPGAGAAASTDPAVSAPGSAPALATVPRTSDTLVLFNNTEVAGNFLAGDGLNPRAVAYDPINGMVYVTEQGTGYVSIIDPATNEVVGSIASNTPGYIVYDSGRGELFVTGGSAGVTVINTTSNTVVANISVPGAPMGLAYDSHQDQVYVADWEANNVSVISDLTNTVIATVPVQDYPSSVAYDPSNGEIFVANSGSNTPNVTVINDTSLTVVANISTGPLGESPGFLQYDPADQDLYVSTASNVSVLSGSGHQVVVNYTLGGYVLGFVYDSGTNEVYATDYDGNLSVFGADTNALLGNFSLGNSTVTGWGDLAYDSAMGELFVTGQTFTVGVVSDSTHTLVANVTVGFTPYATAYDSAKNELFVTSYQYTDQVVIVSLATDRVVKYVQVAASPVDVVYDSGRGEVFVGAGYGISVINDTNDSVVATLPGDAAPNGMAYDPANGVVFVAGEFAGTLIEINDTNLTETTVDTVVAYAFALVYDSGRGQLFVSTYEFGNVTGDNVTVLNASTLAFVANITLPSSSYMLGYDSGKGEVFAATALGQAEDVDVLSDSTDTVVATLDVGSLEYGFAYDPTQGEEYATNFAEGDGHVGANVTVISDATNSLLPTVPVGVGPAGASFDAATDQVLVANYYQGTISIISQVPAYTATFTESGLPSGTSWTVVLNGSTESSTATSIVFDVSNGTLPYTVDAPDGYTATPTSGSLVIDGASATKGIQFAATSVVTPETFPVTFTESGLTSGTSWTVELNGTPGSSATTNLVFQAPNGSEPFLVEAVSGYSVAPGTGSVTIAGHPVSEAVVFTSTVATGPGKNGSSPSSPSNFLGLPGGEGYWLIVILVLLIAVGLTLAVWSRRRGKAPPRPPMSTVPGSTNELGANPPATGGPPS